MKLVQRLLAVASFLFALAPAPAGAQFPKPVPTKPNHVWSAVLSPDGKLAAAGCGWWTEPGEIGIWELASRKRLMTAVERKGVASVAFSPDGALLASGGWSGGVRLRKVPSGEEVADFNFPGVSRVAFSPDGSLLAAAFENKNVRLVDVANRKALAP